MTTRYRTIRSYVKSGFSQCFIIKKAGDYEVIIAEFNVSDKAEIDEMLKVYNDFLKKEEQNEDPR